MSAKISLVCRRRLTPSPLIRRATRSCTESSHSTWQTCGAGKDKGEHFKVGPAVNYLNSLAKQLSDKHKHVNDKTKYFFACEDVNGASDRGCGSTASGATCMGSSTSALTRGVT